jgi:hypothetical protein
MSDKLERIWKEVVMAYSRYYPGIFLEGLKKIMKTLVRIACIPVESETKHFLSTNLVY